MRLRRKKVSIRASTPVKLRPAKRKDFDAFENTYFLCPVVYGFWREFCKMLGAGDSYAAERVTELIFREHMPEPPICGVPGYRYSDWRDITAQYTHNDQNLVYTYHASCYLLDKKGRELSKPLNTPNVSFPAQFNYTNVVNFRYPMGFYDLLRMVEDQIEKEKSRKTRSFFGEPIPLSEGTKKLLFYLEHNPANILPLKKFVEEAKERLARNENYQRFLKASRNGHNALVVGTEIFIDPYCGFNIQDKYREICSIIGDLKAQKAAERAVKAEEKAVKAAQTERERLSAAEEAERAKLDAQKRQNSQNAGEKEVDYAIKWYLADCPYRVAAIKKTCESPYRYNCILLKRDDFIDEAQEYDHILVSGAGVILIETKHWKGRAAIRPDGKWVKDAAFDGRYIGERSPLLQLKRHEALMKKILPEIPLYSILCFSNAEFILDGAENCPDFRVTYVDQLDDVLNEILSSSHAYDDRIGEIIGAIERHKVNIPFPIPINYSPPYNYPISSEEPISGEETLANEEPIENDDPIANEDPIENEDRRLLLLP
ncbi:MAG: NERD domain-containing protein [Bacteroides sp.]|nr:NERD domain-containing protein [Eubacterium sp.]MCM1417596.1 NERD domain-containing protein [Roseburia sp.]MCM1461693.1 NERD domain-containing protein [Bacteroides sp.]